MSDPCMRRRGKKHDFFYHDGKLSNFVPYEINVCILICILDYYLDWSFENTDNPHTSPVFLSPVLISMEPNSFLNVTTLALIVSASKLSWGIAFSQIKESQVVSPPHRGQIYIIEAERKIEKNYIIFLIPPTPVDLIIILLIY